MDLDLIILGAGAAGMMAAVAAGEALAGTSARIAIFEKNVRPGIKVLVCGGGRCNFTNAGSVDFLIAQFGRCGRVLAPALHHLDNEALRAFFAASGVPSHIEPGGKVYPDSNQAKSVVDALIRRMQKAGVEIFAGPNHAATALTREDSTFVLTTTGGQTYRAKCILLALGGMSYQRMGTVGEGYRLASALGHTIVTPRPAIVGLLADEPWTKPLQGLAVRGIELTIPKQGHIKTTRSRGDMLFTHFGLSGPAVLNPSEVIAELLESTSSVQILIDFSPTLSHDELHALLRSWQQTHGKKRLRTMLSLHQPEEPTLIRTTSPDQTDLPPPAQSESGIRISLPVRLAPALCTLESISPEEPCAHLTAAQIHHLALRIKRTPFGITATRGFKEAMVTAGGISLGEVNPDTMESKIVPGLFLTGEVLDLTGPSGGYNLQLAFSTGHLAGTVIAERLRSAAPGPLTSPDSDPLPSSPPSSPDTPATSPE